MAVGRGSILRAADTANKTENITENRNVKPEEPMLKKSVENKTAAGTIHEEKFKVITSLKEELPIYLL